MANMSLIIRPAVSRGGGGPSRGVGVVDQSWNKNQTLLLRNESGWTPSLRVWPFVLFFPRNLSTICFVIVRKKNTMETKSWEVKCVEFGWFNHLIASHRCAHLRWAIFRLPLPYLNRIEFSPKHVGLHLRCVTHRCWPIGSLVLLGDCVADVWLLLSRPAVECLDLNFTKIFGVVYAPKQLL